MESHGADNDNNAPDQELSIAAYRNASSLDYIKLQGNIFSYTSDVILDASPDTAMHLAISWLHVYLNLDPLELRTINVSEMSSSSSYYKLAATVLHKYITTTDWKDQEASAPTFNTPAEHMALLVMRAPRTDQFIVCSAQMPSTFTIMHSGKCDHNQASTRNQSRSEVPSRIVLQCLMASAPHPKPRICYAYSQLGIIVTA